VSFARVTLRRVLWHLNDLWARRELVAALVGRDMRARYKGSALGVAWSLLHPLILAAVYTVAFRYVIRIAIPHYTLFLLSGLLPWLFFAQSLGLASGSIVDQAQLVKKLVFPREVLPLGAVGAQFVQFTIAYLAVIPALAAYQIGASPALLALPFLMVALVIFTSGFALVAAAAQVYLRDTRHLVEVLLQIWFWLTPVVYSLDLVPLRFRPLFSINPLVPFVEAFRDVVVRQRLPSAASVVLLALISVGAFLAGYAIFLRSARRFAEYV
jgi:lipopolysaccharide transport system permease protein